MIDTHADVAADAAHVWDLMEKIGIAMLVTIDGSALRARPMAAHADRNENQIYFLTDAHRHKDEEIARNPHINLSFADAGEQKYVSITGRAEIFDDRAKIKELFSTPAKAWWKNADDPDIRVLKITPDSAEFWDSPGTLVSTIKMATAIVTGTRPDLGDKPQGRAVMPDHPKSDPPEVPPPTPGTPAEPPREDPPGSPHPEIPPVIDDPAQPDQPQEFPPAQPDVIPPSPQQPPTLG